MWDKEGSRQNHTVGTCKMHKNISNHSPLEAALSQLLDGEVHLRRADEQLGLAQLHLLLQAQGTGQLLLLDALQDLLAAVLREHNTGKKIEMRRRKRRMRIKGA